MISMGSEVVYGSGVRCDGDGFIIVYFGFDLDIGSMFFSIDFGLVEFLSCRCCDEIFDQGNVNVLFDDGLILFIGGCVFVCIRD